MAREIPNFPIIEFHDTYGEIHIVKEITESKTFDGEKKIAYTTVDGEDLYFVIKER